MPFTEPSTQGLDTLEQETDLDIFLPHVKQRLLVIRQQIERLQQTPFCAAHQANLQCLYMQLSAIKAIITERLGEKTERQHP
ncbi:hypothetical protein VB780_29845 [Leptolyngbya sp. CCNP1308]|uniref:hypothetical protein n=1 Tax=Leptolyngbya sp. CCNP1308 TaxID=3110255 RepID=UPI002B1F6FCB|nr:hypothetical protein [Leptolyngbya sp. CCNP1308]MEA5452812.1 hypothetical protein [Leptolyngbya sp. CCNP1308]